MFTYLDGIEAISGVKWELKASFGRQVFSRQRAAQETLEELKIAANTLLVVQEV